MVSAIQNESVNASASAIATVSASTSMIASASGSGSESESEIGREFGIEIVARASLHVEVVGGIEG